MNIVKVRNCRNCGQIHDCQFYCEMEILLYKLNKEIDRLIRARYSTPEIHPLEDK